MIMKLFWNYIYAPFVFLFILLWTMLCSFIALVFSFIPNRKLQDALIAVWAKAIMKVLVATIVVEHKEKLPEGGCLLLFNHLSLMDIPLIYTALGPSFRFGAKIELFKIPVFGHALKGFGFLPVERNNRSSTLRTYEKAKIRSQMGEKFILAPEGTRQESLKLGPFKSGPFILAIQAGIPLTPVIITGPERLCPKHKLIPFLDHKVVMTVSVLDPIPTHTYNLDSRNELKDLIWEKMNHVLKEKAR